MIKKDKIKVMISSPMKGKTKADIDNERKEMIENIEKVSNNFEVIDTVIENADELSELECFSKSIEFMSKVDYLCMGYGWEFTRGCKLEHQIAKEYGLPIIYLD